MSAKKTLPTLTVQGMPALWRMSALGVLKDIQGLGYSDRAGWAFCALMVAAALRHPKLPPAYLPPEQLLERGAELLDRLSEEYEAEAILELGAALLRELVPPAPVAADVEEATKNSEVGGA